jgi:hypothetical protein
MIGVAQHPIPRFREWRRKLHATLPSAMAAGILSDLAR